MYVLGSDCYDLATNSFLSFASCPWEQRCSAFDSHGAVIQSYGGDLGCDHNGVAVMIQQADGSGSGCSKLKLIEVGIYTGLKCEVTDVSATATLTKDAVVEGDEPEIVELEMEEGSSWVIKHLQDTTFNVFMNAHISYNTTLDEFAGIEDEQYYRECSPIMSFDVGDADRVKTYADRDTG